MVSQKRPTYSKITLADLTALASARGLPTHGNKIDLIARLVKQDDEQYLENNRVEAGVQAATSSHVLGGGGRVRTQSNNLSTNTLPSPTQPRDRVPPRPNGTANGANARKNGWKDTSKRSAVSSGKKKTNGKEDTKCEQESHTHNNITTDALVRSLMTESKNTFPGTPSTVSNTATRSNTSTHTHNPSKRRNIAEKPPKTDPANIIQTRYGPITVTPTAIPKSSHHKTWVTTTPTPTSAPGERRFLSAKYGKAEFNVVALGIAALLTIGVIGVFVFKAMLLFGGVRTLKT
ncbi:hypothetical protein DM02DRAFT_614089 [Periconia macrospinosa]|uniref:SAP domain-containing protein n=1 Tax=Periconia macrospinosa TaxID=97972 RepID=A0A2V1DS22_9PLEO|nr:hypothetical protein DM02DRAFT_614089 [Periconia macrospinosa]